MSRRLALSRFSHLRNRRRLLDQQRPARPYTQAQAADGRGAYQTYCTSCHGADLNGREGPQRAGSNFVSQLGDRTAGELLRYLQSTMPPGGATLPADSHASLAAFIMGREWRAARGRCVGAGGERHDPWCCKRLVL